MPLFGAHSWSALPTQQRICTLRAALALDSQGDLRQVLSSRNSRGMGKKPRFLFRGQPVLTEATFLSADVSDQAQEDGIDEKVVYVAHKPAVYKYVKVWRLALPLHPEWRTLPMLFNVPPLLPVTVTLNQQGGYEVETDFFTSIKSARLPIRYVASLFFLRR